MRTKIKYALLLAFILCAICINLAGFMRGIDWGDDFAGYIIQAKTLKNGNFKSLQENMGKNDFVLNYPWGFPALLLPVIDHFETDVIFIKKYIYLFFIAALVFTFFLFRREKEKALLTVLFMAASPYFWYFKNYIFSDFSNLCFVLLSLVLIQRIVVRNSKFIHVYLDRVLIGLAIFISFTMRTQSVVLLLVLAVMQLVYQRRNLLTTSVWVPALLPYVTFFCLHLLLKFIIPVAAVSYLAAYKNISWLEVTWNNLFYYTNVWQELFKDMRDLEKVRGAITGVGLFLFVAGISIRWKENFLFLVFILFFIAPVIIAPFYQGLRYLMPLIPVFFYFMVTGAFYISDLLYKTKGKIVAWVFLEGLLIFSFRGNLLLSRDNLSGNLLMEGPYSPSSVEVFDFLKKNTAQESLIGHWKPRAMLLYSGRNCVLPLTLNDCFSRHINYYVYNRNAYADQLSLDSLLLRPKSFQRVYENKDFQVFKVIHDPMFNIPAEITEIKPVNAGDLVRTINYEDFDKTIIVEAEKFIPLWSNGQVASRPFRLQKGSYILSVFSKGSKAAGEYALNKIVLNEQELGVFYSKEKPFRQDLEFTLDETRDVSLKMKLENDLEKNGEDRNTLIYFLNIYKKLP